VRFLLSVRRVSSGIHVFHMPSVFPAGLDKAEYYRHIYSRYTLRVCLSEQKVGCKIEWYCMSIFMYADDIVLLAPSISPFQDLLHVCEVELALLDMTVNASKSMSTRIGPRHKYKCCELTTMRFCGQTIRYLDVYLFPLRNLAPHCYRLTHCDVEYAVPSL